MPSRTPPNRQVLEEAAAWFVDFRADDLDPSGRERFRHWLQRSPEHIQAYLEIAGTYAELPEPEGILDTRELIANARSSADGNVVAFCSDKTEKGESTRMTNRKVVPGKGRLALAASVVLALSAAAVWLHIQRGTYSTEIGEQRTLTLADGSTVELNSRSRIRVRYADHERHIDLLEGQALFTVAKNKSRPFIVQGGATQVRAVGTQFDVYQRQTGTTVTVIEGTVAVRPGSSDVHDPRETAAQSLLLIAGEQLIVTPKLAHKSEHPSVVAATAWTQHQLVFDDVPLTEVAAEFNRYNTRAIIIDQPELTSFHITGNYSSTKPDSLLRFLRSQPGIKITETDREIHISKELP
jgi:transmembrane sensor